MNKKRKGIKRIHNGIDRHTGRRVAPRRTAYEPSDGNKKGKTNRENLSQADREAFDKNEERKQKRRELANLARQEWLAERSQKPEPCCDCEEARDAKNIWLLEQLKAVNCDTVVDELTGVKVSRIIPRSFEHREAVRKHMHHFAPFAKKNGFTRHWR